MRLIAFAVLVTALLLAGCDAAPTQPSHPRDADCSPMSGKPCE